MNAAPSSDPAPSLLSSLRTKPAAALREVFREGYGRRDLLADALAGIVVGIVALPLAMALAIASGVPPQYGLYTSIVAGGTIAILGGSRYQVSGPTAAFVVILAPIAAQFGVGGLLVSSVMAGVMLFAMGFFRLGKIIEFIPYTVMTGFTAGIGVTIAAGQVKHLFGLQPATDPGHVIEKVIAYSEAAATARWPDFLIGAAAFALLLGFPRLTRRVPAPLVALGIAAILGEILTRSLPGFHIATIGNSFSYGSGADVRPGIPQLPPLPAWPWSHAGADGNPLGIDLALLRALVPSAFAIAMLGAIESLLSAAVADGMTGRKHDSDAELMAQGVGNMTAPFFGGIAATGAIARTATGIRAGARSPIAAIVHSIFVLAAVLSLAPLLAYLPMAGLAALLILVAWNMSDAKHFVHILRVAPKHDVLVLLTCFLLTVVFDMVISVSFGVVLAALLFMKRMVDVTEVSLLTEEHHAQRQNLPKGTVQYEIAGPLFFGVAQKAMGALTRVDSANRTVILDLESVPTMDMTGLVALESALERLWKSGAFVVIAGVRAPVYGFLAKGGITNKEGKLAVCRTYDEAIDYVWTREAHLAVHRTVEGARSAAPPVGAARD
jgi:SulP family sulfate permease